MKKALWFVVSFLLLAIGCVVIASSFGTEAKKTEFVTLARPDGNLSECKLPAGAVLGNAKWMDVGEGKGAEREIYSVPFGSPSHAQGGCQAGDRILNRTFENGR